MPFLQSAGVSSSPQVLLATVPAAVVDGSDAGPNNQPLTIPADVAPVASLAGFSQAAEATDVGALVNGPKGITNAQGAIVGSAFTFECILSIPSIPSADFPIAAREGSEWGLFVNNAGYLYIVWHDAAGAQHVFNSGTISLTVGAGHHVAFTWDGADVRTFVGGALDQTYPIASAAAPSLGSLQFFQANVVSGMWIDEVRISNVARYLAAYSPATAPFTSDSNTGCLYHLDTDNAAVDVSLPDNCVSLIVSIPVAGWGDLTTVTGKTTGHRYPLVQFPVSGYENAFYTAVAMVVPVQDPEVTVRLGAPVPAPWYIVADASVRTLAELTLRSAMQQAGGSAPADGLAILGYDGANMRYIRTDQYGQVYTIPGTAGVNPPVG